MAIKLSHRMARMSPYRIFQIQVQGSYKALSRKTYNYLPPSMGGIEGQRRLLQSQSVMVVADFEVSGG